MKTAIIKVYAGSGWEGHVVYRVIHPDNESINHVSSNMEEVEDFCSRYKLAIDPVFKEKLLELLVYETGTGLIIPPEYIDEESPVSSAHKFLKTYIPEYCL